MRLTYSPRAFVHILFSALFILSFQQVRAQCTGTDCPSILAIMVDACGTESLNEFVIIYSGNGFNTSNLQFDFDPNNNFAGAVNNDINIGASPCGLISGNAAMIGGCPNVTVIGAGFDVPPNSIVVLQTSNGSNQAYDFSSVCGMGQCIYVISSSCTRTAGAFTNAGPGIRTQTLSIAGCPCSETLSYDRALLSDNNGDFIFAGAPGNNGCTAPPAFAAFPPIFNPMVNVTQCGSYTLPAITGTNLTGGEAYFTGSNGMGTRFSPGDVITTTTSLFIFDPTTGCSDQKSFTVTITPPPTVTASAMPTAICPGQNTTLSATAGFASYSWSNGATTQTTVVNTATTYTVTVTNAAGCQNTATVTVNNAPPPPVTITPSSSSICLGGTANLNATPGLASYAWSTGESTPSVTIFSSGLYTVTVTNAAGCTNTAFINISQAPSPNPIITGANFICEGGQAILDAGVHSTYQWSTGAPTRFITVTNPGFYTVTVTNAQGCQGVTSRDISLVPNPTPSISGPSVICSGNNAILDAGAGYSSYQWSTGGATRQITVNSGGTYRVTVTNPQGCRGEDEISLSSVPRPSITPIADVSACGTYTLPPITGTNLTGNEAYFTAPNGGGARFEPGRIINSTTFLFVYDGEPGCNDQRSFTITINPKPTLNPIPNQSVCGLYTLPAITGTGLTGNQAYYTAPNGGGTRLNPGSAITTSQTIYIYDTNGPCNDQQQFTVTITPGPNVNDLPDVVACGSFTLPAITGVSLTGNQAYYTAPNGGGTRLNPGDVLTTSQTIYIYDGNGACADQESFTVSIATTPTLTAIADQTACGSFTFAAIQGTNLSGGQAYYTQPNGAGTRYLPGESITTSGTFYAYDGAPGCSAERSFAVNIAEVIDIEPFNSLSTCGTFLLPPIAGTNLSGNQAYFTQPNGGGTRLNAGDAITATTTLFIFDTNGPCSDQESFTITINAEPVLDAVNNVTTCGSYTLQAITGQNLSGNQAYFTQPNGGGIRFNPGDVITNSQTLYIYDNNGACDDDVSFNIVINSLPQVNPVVQNITCAASANGTISLNVNGNAPFLFNWNTAVLNGQQNATGLSAGSYQVTITDVNGCFTMVNATVLEPDPLTLTCAQLTPVTGFGATDGRAQITISGGTAPFVITWTGAGAGTQMADSQGIQVVEGLAAGSYNVTIRDANNCTTVCTFVITAPGCNLEVNFTQQNLTCSGDTNGRINLTLTGGTAPFNFDWNVDALDGRQNPTGLVPGNYSVIVTDANGCTDAADIVLIAENESPIIQIAGDGNVCEGDCYNFAFTLTGTAPFVLQYDVFNGTSTRSFFESIAENVPLEVCIGGFGVRDGDLEVRFIAVQDANCRAVIMENRIVTVRPTELIFLNETLCSGDSIVVNGVVYNANNPNGIEVLVGASQYGCDSVVSINLNFLPAPVTTINSTLCQGESITVNGNVYDQNTPSGIERIPGVSPNGCDSTIIINLNFVSPAIVNIDSTLCAGGSLTLNGTVYDATSPSGTEIIIGGAANGCDSIINVNLDFRAPAVFNLTQTLCAGNSLEVNGRLYDANNPSGQEILPGAALGGCDSTININLTFVPAIIENVTQTLCANETLLVNGTVYDATNPSGTELIPNGSASGCDSIINVNLNFLPSAISDVDATLCTGESLIINGTVYNATNPIGVETIANGTANGCDSIINVRLTFLQPVITDLAPSLCPNESLTVNGRVYDATNRSGVEIITNGAANGCDSIINVNLSFLQPVVTDFSPVLCSNESARINGTLYDANNPTGVETIANGASNGCDSIITINLSFLPPVIFDFNTILCANERLTVNGTLYDVTNPAGVEIIPNGAANGCDSIINVNLNFLSPVTTNVNSTLCTGESISINGTIYDAANPNGVEIIPNGAANGCDSIINVSLNFLSPIVSDFNATLCAGESVVVNGTIYNANNPTGIETIANGASNGCDSIINIQLQFINAVSTQIVQTLCPGESLTVNGRVYDVNNPSGTETLVGGAANGCDSIINVNLSFLPAVRGAIEGNTSICAGSEATLTFRLSGAPQFTVRYSGGGQSIELADIRDGHTVRVSPMTTTTYRIEFIAVTGTTCPAVIEGGATVQVSTLSAQAAVTSNFGGFGVSCTNSQDATLQATALGGIAPFSYRWNTNATSAQLQNVGAGDYSVLIRDAAGCEATATAIVTAPTSINLSSSVREPLCSGSNNGAIIIQNITGGAEPFEVSLNGNTYRAINGFPYELPNLRAGAYTIYVRDINDCEVTLQTAIAAPIEPRLELGDNIIVRLGDSALIEGQTNFTPTKIEWTPTTFLSDPQSLRTVVTPTETTTYRLTVLDDSGCRATDVITVFVSKERRIFIPNAFSPDGDGSNDVFYINGGNEVVKIHEFRIFDRWGNQMFQRGAFQPNDPAFGWDGTFLGRPVNVGVYVYYASIEFSDGEVETFKGEVTVLR